MVRIREPSAKAPSFNENNPSSISTERPMSGSPSVIGIVGTAKNTGKTTTLSSLLIAAYQKALSLGITGIGYDGEEIDTVTSLPKPRLYLTPGMIATTAESCIKASSIRYELLRRTGYFTALGEVVIVRVLQDGLVVIAGPNRLRALQDTLEMMRVYNIQLFLVDGSLNRVSPMTVADKIIFTTGGARSTDVNFLSEEMKSIAGLFHLDCASASHAHVVEAQSLLDKQDVEVLLENSPPTANVLSIESMVSSDALTAMLAQLRQRPGSISSISINDPLKLLLAGEPFHIAALVEKFREMNIRLTVRHRPAFAAVTVNPFYPVLKNFAYSARYLNKDELLSAVRKTLNVPVLNVKDNGAEDLLRLCVG
jgi:hypothetical protein